MDYVARKVPGFIGVINTLKNYFPQIILINNTPNAIADKISTHSLYGFTIYEKMQILNSYNIECSILDCFICSNNQI